MAAFLNFMIFPKISGPGARTFTGPAGKIRGGLHQYLSHSDEGPKITYKEGISKNRYNIISEWSLGHSLSGSLLPCKGDCHLQIICIGGGLYGLWKISYEDQEKQGSKYSALWDS